MNLTKTESDSDPETSEPYSQFQFTSVHQKLMSLPVSFTEVTTEIKVRGWQKNKTGISVDVLGHGPVVCCGAVIWCAFCKEVLC
jgi:hypothetical protein